MPKVIPARLGGVSPIKHIVVIVKENRTYDQVLGDLGEGNGDPADAQFGAQVTPNSTALATRFGDLDNFYDEGTLSADGHNWLVQAEANDYVEKEFGAFYRSYPSQGGDSLAYQRDGFLWNAAEKAGLSVQNFGEYIYNPYSLPAERARLGSVVRGVAVARERADRGPSRSATRASTRGRSRTSRRSRRSSDPCFPNFQLAIPDQYRVDQWLPVFQQQEQSGQMPNLTFMWLMTDHTGATGVNGGSTVPDPVAQVADNDLAVGRVVDTISHSRFWKSTAIFIVEDDTQNGVDHVDGHRGPAFVVSPYSASGVDDSYYTQLNMVKTIEQILGIHADEPGGPGGRADVRRVHAAPGLRAVHAAAEPDPAQRWALPAVRRRSLGSADRLQRGRTQGVRHAGRRPGQHAVGLRRRGRRGAGSRRPSTTSTVRTASTRSS